MSRSTSRALRHRQSRPAIGPSREFDILVDRNALERRDGQLAHGSSIGFPEWSDVDGHISASYVPAQAVERGLSDLERQRIAVAAPSSSQSAARRSAHRQFVFRGSDGTMTIAGRSNMGR